MPTDRFKDTKIRNLNIKDMKFRDGKESTDLYKFNEQLTVVEQEMIRVLEIIGYDFDGKELKQPGDAMKSLYRVPLSKCPSVVQALRKVGLRATAPSDPDPRARGNAYVYIPKENIRAFLESEPVKNLGLKIPEALATARQETEISNGLHDHVKALLSIIHDGDAYPHLAHNPRALHRQR